MSVVQQGDRAVRRAARARARERASPASSSRRRWPAWGRSAVAARLHRRLGAPPLRFSSETARELFTAGSPILAMTAAIAVQPYLDAIILSKLAPATVVGWFGAAKNILGTLMAPAVILGAAAYPRLARASADAASLRREVRAAFRPLLWLGGAGRDRHLPVRGHRHPSHLRRRAFRPGGDDPRGLRARALPPLHRYPAREHHLRLRGRERGSPSPRSLSVVGGDRAGRRPHSVLPGALRQRRDRGGRRLCPERVRGVRRSHGGAAPRHTRCRNRPRRRARPRSGRR